MSVLVQLTLSTTLLLATAAVLTRALRRSSAGARSLIWSIAIAAVCAAPLVAPLLPRVELPLLPTEPQRPALAASAAVVEDDRPAATTFSNDGAGTHRDLTTPARKQPQHLYQPRLPDRDGLGAARSQPRETGGEVAAATAGRTAQRGEPRAAAGDSQPHRADGETATRPPVGAWLLVAWAAGASLLLVQLLGGLGHVVWMARRSHAVTDGVLSERLTGAARRIGLRRSVRLLESDTIAIPVTWHYLRPVVLIPRGMRAWSPDCQAAVLIHELEHVRRLDCWTQLLAQIVVAVQWFNPLAWYAAHQLGAEREHACDDAVLRAGFRPSTYARHLLEVASSVRRPPRVAAVALARSTRLRGRVETILDPTIGRQSPNRRATVSFASIALMLVLPIAALQPVAGLSPVIVETGAPPAAVGMPTPSTEVGGSAPLPRPRPGIEPAPSSAPSAAPRSEPVPTPAPQARPRPSIKQLVKMRIHGVSPDFIAEMNDLFGPDLDIDELVTLRIHGVSGDFARQMRGALGNLDMNDLVNARIHGVSPDFAARMAREIGESVTFDSLRQMRIHGISSEFVSAMSELFDDPDIRDLVQMRIHGVTGEYARAMRASLGEGLDLDDLVSGRIHGVSTEYAERMGELLDEELDFETLVKMRIHGVSTAWVEELQEAGYEELTAEDLVDIKIHGMGRILLKRRGERR